MDSAHSDKAQVRILPEEYLVFIDIAGIPTSSLKVHIDGHQLLIYGEHEECITKGGRRACWERTIEEIFDLPEDADQEQVEAWVNLQVLHVKIPRKALKADRVIKVGHKGTIEKILEKVGFEE